MPSEILGAAFDVAVERLGHLHPSNQVFVFSADGELFWANQAVRSGQLDELRDALLFIEQVERTHRRPFSVAGPSRQYSALALDAEGDLYAVVLVATRPPLAAEVRAGRQSAGATESAPDWLRAWRR